jgi:hypothetical protein
VHLGEALAAVHGPIIVRLERHLAGLATLCANRIIHLALTVAIAGASAGIPALLAALGLVLESALRIKFLFTGGKDEFLAAVFADQSFVFVHKMILLKISLALFRAAFIITYYFEKAIKIRIKLRKFLEFSSGVPSAGLRGHRVSEENTGIFYVLRENLRSLIVFPDKLRIFT